MPLSDPSGTYTRAVRPKPSPAGLLASLPSRHPRGLPVLVSEVSRRAGVFDYAGLAGNLALSFPVMLPSAFTKSVGTLIGCFRSSIALPTYTSVYASLGTSRRRSAKLEAEWIATPFS